MTKLSLVTLCFVFFGGCGHVLYYRNGKLNGMGVETVSIDSQLHTRVMPAENSGVRVRVMRADYEEDRAISEYQTARRSLYSSRPMRGLVMEIGSLGVGVGSLGIIPAIQATTTKRTGTIVVDTKRKRSHLSGGRKRSKYAVFVAPNSRYRRFFSYFVPGWVVGAHHYCSLSPEGERTLLREAVLRSLPKPEALNFFDDVPGSHVGMANCAGAKQKIKNRMGWVVDVYDHSETSGWFEKSIHYGGRRLVANPQIAMVKRSILRDVAADALSIRVNGDVIEHMQFIEADGTVLLPKQILPKGQRLVITVKAKDGRLKTTTKHRLDRGGR